MDRPREIQAVVILLVPMLLLAGCSPADEGFDNIPPSASGSYSDPDGNSSIVSYSYNEDSILVLFSDGATYTYTNDSAGADNVRRMKVLAQLGNGLNAFINQNVRDRYASHEEARQSSDISPDTGSRPSLYDGPYSAAFDRIETLLVDGSYPNPATGQQMFDSMVRLAGSRGYFTDLNDRFATLSRASSRELALTFCEHWAGGRTIEDFPEDTRMDAALVSLMASNTVCTKQAKTVMRDLML